MPIIPDSKDKLVNLEDMRALYEHELRDNTIKFIDGQPGFTPAGSMQLGTGCVGSLTPVEKFGICKVTSGSMSDLTDFSSAFSMTNVGFSCSPDGFNGSETISYDGSSTMKSSLAGFESNENKSVLYADIDEMEVDGGSSSYTKNRARAALTSSFIDGISSALSLDVSDRHREFDLTLQVTSGEYSMSSDSPVFVKTDPNLSPIGKLAPVSPSPSVPMTLPEIDDLPTPRRTDADLPGLVVPDDETIVCENRGIISIKRRGVSEPLLSHDVMSQLTGLQEIGPTGIANIENALPGPLVTTKVMGQSNQQQEPAPSPENPQEITNLTNVELVITGRNICPDAELLGEVAYNTGIPTNPYGTQAKFPYVQPSETSGIGAVLNTIKGVTYSIAYLGKANTAAVGIAEYKSVDDVGDVSKVVSYARVGSSKKNSLTASIDGVMVFVLASQWADGKTNLNTFAKEDMIISIGKPQDTYVPYAYEKTPIDLHGNELCSLPNGVKDEVVIDAEGNVSLMKRVTSALVTSDIIQSAGEHENGQKYVTIVLNNCVRDEKPNVMCSTYTSNIYTDSDKQIYIPSSTGAVITDSRFADKETAANILTAMNLTIFYQLAEPQTIPLGKVELPALPEATSNVWNDGNIPADVSIIFYNENGRLLSKAIPEVDVATVDEVKKFLGIK